MGKKTNYQENQQYETWNGYCAVRTSAILKQAQAALIQSLEKIIEGFSNYLQHRGLKPSTAAKHTANARLLLIEYHAYYFLEGLPALKPERIWDFLGIWYFQKTHFPTQTGILSLLTSIKHLAGYLAYSGILPYESCHRIKQVCADKLYFLHRLKEFQNNPPHGAFTASPQESSRNGFIDMIAALRDNLQDDLFWKSLTAAHTHISLQDLLNTLHARLFPVCGKRNVISLEPYLKVYPPGRSRPQESGRHVANDLSSLTDHCFAMHRTNLVFLRWLERYRCQLSDIPSEAVAVYLDCDHLLAYLLTQLQTQKLTAAEIRLGHRILDLMDQVIWSLRHKISHYMGLDLRSLPL